MHFQEHYCHVLYRKLLIYTRYYEIMRTKLPYTTTIQCCLSLVTATLAIHPGTNARLRIPPQPPEMEYQSNTLFFVA